ncbi:glycerophosphodiester phosphodiesterase [Aliidiomarina sanyensis]|uniref:GP-PDE domain-containing protein n=1 Tax=Aliidiomarina sanyensis TaxID=1249555 RepID=A0A432WAX6_9GAMM|nr:glycerophosphodiester phosphodiesterase family protein [Aliidiomarina sanyensis]RUO27530.1 hypothetical protein CWE11_11320 [Aliidiomarina sanyensis]
MTEWISHRGFIFDDEGKTPRRTENTRAAFDAAIALNFTHLETDLRTSRDGHIVLCHDPDLKRVSGQDIPIDQLTRKELEALSLAHGESLFFFDELLNHYGHLNWILDIKPEQAERTVQVLEALAADGEVARFLREQVRYLFWDRDHQQKLTHVMPEAFCLARQNACYRAGVATLIGLPGVGGIESGQYYAVPPKVGGVPVLSSTLVSRFHAQDARVIGYLPTSAQEHETALQAGVDQLLTNYAHLKVKTNS